MISCSACWALLCVQLRYDEANERNKKEQPTSGSVFPSVFCVSGSVVPRRLPYWSFRCDSSSGCRPCRLSLLFLSLSSTHIHKPPPLSILPPLLSPPLLSSVHPGLYPPASLSLSLLSLCHQRQKQVGVVRHLGSVLPPVGISPPSHPLCLFSL